MLHYYYYYFSKMQLLLSPNHCYGLILFRIPLGLHINADPNPLPYHLVQVENHSGDTFIGHSKGTKQEGGEAEL